MVKKTDDQNDKNKVISNNYYNDRSERSNDKTDELIAELPYFCAEFLYGTANNTSALTRMNYAYDLRIFFEYISKVKKIKVTDMQLSILDELKAYDIERFLNYLSNYVVRNKKETCDERGKARKLSTIRAMYRYFFNRDKIQFNVASKVETPKLHEKEIIRLEGDEVRRLLEFVENDDSYDGKKNAYHKKLKTRDFAILSLFLGTGIRISELVGLNVDDFDFDKNSFVVTRKGGNRTILFYNDEVKEALYDWLDVRYSIKEVDPNDKAMFISLKNQRISTRAVQVLVKNYAQQVTPLKNITPHKLRSTFGTNLYRQTGDIYAVSDFLGHKDVNTTRKHYAAVSKDSRKHSANIVSLKDDYDT